MSELSKVQQPLAIMDTTALGEIVLNARIVDITTGEVFEESLRRHGAGFAWYSTDFSWDGTEHLSLHAARAAHLQASLTYTAGADVSYWTPRGPEETRQKKLRDVLAQLARFDKSDECTECNGDSKIPNPKCANHRLFQPEFADEDAVLDSLIARARELTGAPNVS
jgi:hypothetical protein